jgi:hypothetical protein
MFRLLLHWSLHKRVNINHICPNYIFFILLVLHSCVRVCLQSGPFQLRDKTYSARSCRVSLHNKACVFSYTGQTSLLRYNRPFWTTGLLMCFFSDNDVLLCRICSAGMRVICRPIIKYSGTFKEMMSHRYLLTCSHIIEYFHFKSLEHSLLSSYFFQLLYTFMTKYPQIILDTLLPVGL